MDLTYTYRDDGTVALGGPHRSDPILEGTLGYLRYFIGLDLGSAQDPSGISVIEDRQMPLPEYDPGGRQLLSERRLTVVHLERLHGRAYTEIARHAASLLQRAPLRGRSKLVIDATGPGRPFCDVLREAGIDFTGIQMTSGQGVTRGERGLMNVGKNKLLYDLAGYLETNQLKVAANMPLTKAFLQELSEFRADISAAGNLIVDVRAKDHHGDLVIATALALWSAARPRGVFEVISLDGWV